MRFPRRTPGAAPIAARNLRSRRGAGVLEVVISTLILAITAILLVGFFARGRVWFDQEEKKRVATLVAQDAMEQTVVRPYDQVLAWNQQRTVSSTRYTIAVTVVENSPMTNMKTVRSRVSWQATASAQRNVTLSTLLRR